MRLQVGVQGGQIRLYIAGLNFDTNCEIDDHISSEC